MAVIGGSITEAIDWTQDHLVTTRPLAEQTLFSLLHDAKVTETEQGFILQEDDEEEVRNRYATVKHQISRNFRRYRFRGKRAPQRNSSKRLDYADTVAGMWHGDDDDSSDD